MTSPATPIRDLFSADVTRDIPPVVYFHEQSPEKLEAEVSEYIVTGGYPESDPRHRRVPDGIHEQFVRLLNALHASLKRSPELPASWISGFYGSGKSSFAKLIGLALDGRKLPDGRTLEEALLGRDESPKRQELIEAWTKLRSSIDPIAVVFDIGAIARDGEHIHAAAVRQVASRLGYSSTSALVAETELKLEMDGRWDAFLAAAEGALDRSWGSAKNEAMVDDHFSAALHRLDPAKYTDPMSWVDARAGSRQVGMSVDEAIRAIEAMLARRAPGKTLYMVVDEVSQYVHQDEDRMLKLQSFVSALGSRLKGGAWLLATGQQKLDDDAGTTLQKLKDRFPPALRVHLSPTNIRDVVHRRLLHKNPARALILRELFQRHRTDLKLNAFGCHDVTEEDFVEIYPLLPGHVELLMDITSALRLRSLRSQGDHHAIRGLLQLLGELFRNRKLADEPVGRLVTLDDVYDVQYSSLDASLQSTLTQVLNHDSVAANPLAARIVKAVALLEQVQEWRPTTAELVARVLYDRIGAPPIQRDVDRILEELRQANCLSFSEQYGFKIQSSAGQDWQREREIPVPDEQVHDLVMKRLPLLMADPERPKFRGRGFTWFALFSDRYHNEQRLLPTREDTVVTVDFRYLTSRDERREEVWIPRSADKPWSDRLVWVVGDLGDLVHLAREFKRSNTMVETYRARLEGLSQERRRLLVDEEARLGDLEKRFADAVRTAFLDGAMYFRGRRIAPRDMGTTFADAVRTAAERFLPDLYQHYCDIAVTDREWPQLLDRHFDGVSPKFYESGLGILGIDAGQTVVTCTGTVPDRILRYLEDNNGASGTVLIRHFAGPPYGYALDIVRACLVGLLRAGRITINPDGLNTPITSYADPGTRDLFATDRALRQADYLPAKDSEITQRDRIAIRKFFDRHLNRDVSPENEELADAAFKDFPVQRSHLREVERLYERLPGRPPLPGTLEALAKALETCVADRHIDNVIKALKRNLEKLADGLELLGIIRAELTDEAVAAVEQLHAVQIHHVAQLRETGLLDGDTERDARSIADQLALERPWRGLADAQAAALRVKEAYRRARRAVLGEQEGLAEDARLSVKRRDGFTELTAEQSNHVLRPVFEAVFKTDADSLAPSLISLKGQFPERLRRGVEDANDRLDVILEAKNRVPIKPVRLPGHGRELKSKDDLRTLLREIEEEVTPLLEQGVRVRIT